MNKFSNTQTVLGHHGMLKRGLAAVSLLFALLGCSGMPATQTAFDEHEARFSREVAFEQHEVFRADGARVAVREFNSELRAKGPSLVLMHGFPDNQHLYDALVSSLGKSHHILSFDFVGWGASDKPPQALYDVASQRADLDALIKHFSLEQVVPVVHDMSGQVGIDWVIDNPARTSALVLLNTYYMPSPTLKAPPAIETFASQGWFRDLRVWGASRAPSLFQGGVQSQMADFLSSEEARDRWVPILSHRAPEIRPAFFSSTSVLWKEIRARAEKRDQLARVQAPVLVAFGKLDPYLNEGVALDMARSFPQSTLKLIDGGHYVQIDNPSAVSTAIKEILADGKNLKPLVR